MHLVFAFGNGISWGLVDTVSAYGVFVEDMFYECLENQTSWFGFYDMLWNARQQVIGIAYFAINSHPSVVQLIDAATKVADINVKIGKEFDTLIIPGTTSSHEDIHFGGEQSLGENRIYCSADRTFALSFDLAEFNVFDHINTWDRPRVTVKVA